MLKTEEMLRNSGGASFDTLGELSSLLCSAKSHQHHIPAEFIVPESLRPTLAFDATASSDDPLPVLDLADVDHRGGQLAAKLTEMCEEWGFVQVVNHGVPSHILREMASSGHAFFMLPSEHKKRGAMALFDGYGPRFFNVAGVGTPWSEGLTFMMSPESNIAAFEAKMWPDHPNDALRQTLQQFDAAMEKLETTLLQLLAEGLGLETTFFSQHFDKCAEKRKVVHFNYYPPCRDPSKVLGARAHADASLLTVLYQDRVSGLQIQAKDGSWHPVHVKQDGLLVLVGDILEGWSNGRLPAGVHRAVVNDKIPRLSFVHSYNPALDFLIQPAPIGGAPRYKAFSSKEYLAFRNSNARQAQHPGDPRRPMDVYAAHHPVDVPVGS